MLIPSEIDGTFQALFGTGSTTTFWNVAFARRTVAVVKRILFMTAMRTREDYYGCYQYWRYRLSAGFVDTGDAYDAGVGTILWWAGAPEECALNDHAQLLYARAD